MTGKNKCPYTKEELISILQTTGKVLDRKPTWKDMPYDIRMYYKIVFGKWCYALEEAGLSVPSQKTLDRRKRHKERHKRKRTKQDSAIEMSN
ncbi:MAG: hypothetical protein IKF07_06795 [Eubacterium sp.]|nr:hypothetical protein [Eubacterium sp.]